MTTLVGQTITLQKGKQIYRTEPTRAGRDRLSRDTTVTVRKTEEDRRGKTRIFWLSNGYKTSALV